jgi:hypothetical protein
MVDDPWKPQYLAGEAELIAARRLAQAFTVGRDLAQVLRNDVRDAMDRRGVDPDQLRALGRVADARIRLWREFDEGQYGPERAAKGAAYLARSVDQSLHDARQTPAPAETIQQLDEIIGQLRRDARLAGDLWIELAREVNRPLVQDPASLGAFGTGDRVGELAEMQKEMMAAAEQLARADIYLEQSYEATRNVGAAVTAALWQGLTRMRPSEVSRDARAATQEQSGPELT